MDARFNEIQETVLAARNEVDSLNALEILTTSEQTLTGANSTSKVSQWRLWIWIFSFAVWLLEKVTIENSKNTKEQNLVNLKAAILEFHYGLDLQYINNSWQYDLTDVVEPDNLKVIKKTAIVQPENGGLIVKISGASGPITNEQFTSFKDYFFKKKVPGIPVQYVNTEGDLLRLTMTVYVDTQTIELATGKLINSDDVYPVKDAIQAYLSKLEFNGNFVKKFFEKEILSVDGVYLVEIIELQWSYASYPYVDFGPFKNPESGYFIIPNDNLTINYLSDALVYS